MIEDNEHFKVIDAAYPHIGKKLSFLWGHPEFNTVITGLIYDTREGKRMGFPEPVLNAIFSLGLSHELEHPQLLAKQKEVWNLRHPGRVG
jgi:hypothetical protein